VNALSSVLDKVSLRVGIGVNAFNCARLGKRGCESVEVSGVPRENSILVGVSVTLSQNALHHIDTVTLTNDGLAASIGLAERAEFVLLFITESSSVRKVESGT